MKLLDLAITTSDLPYPELCAARLDGELYALDSAFISVDTPETAQVRAESIAVVWPDRLIAEQHSAAWVLGATPVRPVDHELCADISARSRPSTARRARIREVVIAPDEIVRVGRLEVTSPLRTVIDIARFSAAWGEEERRIRDALFDAYGITLEVCRAALDGRRNLPNKKLAWTRLNEST